MHIFMCDKTVVLLMFTINLGNFWKIAYLGLTLNPFLHYFIMLIGNKLRDEARNILTNNFFIMIPEHFLYWSWCLQDHSKIVFLNWRLYSTCIFVEKMIQEQRVFPKLLLFDFFSQILHVLFQIDQAFGLHDNSFKVKMKDGVESCTSIIILPLGYFDIFYFDEILNFLIR